MTRIHILKKDGSASPYFWSDDDGSHPTRKRVYLETRKGVEDLPGVVFDSVKKRMHRQPQS
jgi:hypothetical protein